MSDEEEPKNFFTQLWGEAQLLAEPVLGAYDPWRRARLMRALGWDLEAISGVDARAFEEWVGKIGPALESLTEALADLKLDSLANVIKIGEAFGAAYGQISALPPAVEGKLPDLDGLPEELADDLLDYLLLTYLNRRVPWTVPLLALLGLVTPAAEQSPSLPMPPGDVPIRLPRRRDELHLDRIVDMIAKPGEYFKARYAPAGWDTPEGVELMAARLLPRLAHLLRALGVDAAQGVRPGIGPDQGEAGLRLADSLLRVRFSGLRTPGGDPPPTALHAPGESSPTAPTNGGATSLAELAAAAWQPTFGVGLTLGLASWDGLLTAIVAPTGEVNLTGSFGSWNVATELAGAGPAIAINSNGVDIAGGSPSLKFSAEIARIAPEGEAGWVFGATEGTHLAVGQVVLSARAALGTGRDDLEFTLRAGRAELVVKAGDGDGLLAKLLPADGLRLAFELGVGWSLRAGLHLAGATALAADYPMHLSRWGIHLEGLRIALAADSRTKRVSLVVSTSIRAELGPLHATVDHIGVRADLTFPPAVPAGAGGEARTGNLGIADLAPRFKMPDGVGLRIDNGFVSGGGYLFVDEARGMYAGALQLGIATKSGIAPMRGFQLQTVAVLNTRNTDGSRLTEADGGKTFSLLVVGTFQWFPGLMLFWGISITGLGLVVGYNRRSNPDEVRNAARAGTLDALLFPEDVVGRAPAVIATLSRIFPVDTTGTVVGAMVRLNFLSGQVVADLAVLVEFPDPVRILLLGKLVIDFKDAGKLRLDSAGIVDFARKEITLDAALIDSKLFGRPVSGEMAMRARWGADKAFALAIGGFHPRFPAPTGFPTLKRFNISLRKSGKGLNLEAYLAVTSNTAQFGAQLLVHFEGGGFLIDGRAWLDVMFQFKPFWFSVEIGATVSLKFKGTELLAINLFIALSGPGPWRAKGEARIKFLFWEASAKFDWTDDAGHPHVHEPTYINAADELVKPALTGPGAWDAGPAVTGAEPVSLRAIEAGEALLLSPGMLLGVRENVVPLDVELQRIGTSRIRGANRFTLTDVHVGHGDGAVRGTLGAELFDDFAPGQFRDLTPEEQMVTPGLERLAAGRTVRLPNGTTLPATEDTVFVGLAGDEAYDRVIIDDPDDAGRPMPAQQAGLARHGGPDTGGLLARFAATGPAANARTRTTGATRFTGAPLGLVDAGPSWVPARATRPAGGGRWATSRATSATHGRHSAADLDDRFAAAPVATATEAAATAPRGDRAARIRRAAVPVPRPTIALVEPRERY
ncbi:hypothetical protein GCM10027280_54470 [Micromonospora polyrhachis]|uniref:DUF6603 domain-containing protein n=1 Tax=Micromonospora polyrhachis TaxID=1282883 RepID=A0A7W7WS13_9ACTN|nr:DUF6603 domain-containing protein [Micromonospora polyrhachis]MBB4961831.1 hypothetical protein [Micromonospora polyrhachis]